MKIEEEKSKVENVALEACHSLLLKKSATNLIYIVQFMLH